MTKGTKFVLLYAIAIALVLGVHYARAMAGDPQAVWFFHLIGLL